MCNCRYRGECPLDRKCLTECPLDRKCLTECIIYKATVPQTESNSKVAIVHEKIERLLKFFNELIHLGVSKANP